MNLSRVAAKQLTASDLTFFASHFHRPGQRSKQKAINLNADVFVLRFYPGLRDRFTEIHFGLTIVGPGVTPPYTVSRKALRSPGAKNWRLNGELINDPPEEPGRFDNLAEGDIAILSFEGAERPERVVMVLVSAQSDPELHGSISSMAHFEARQSMRPLTFAQLQRLVETTRSSYEVKHPLDLLLRADTVEDVIYGSAQAQEAAVASDGRGMMISPESLRRNATEASETGQHGEEAFERWLIQEGCEESDFEWVSQTHARAAYDFTVAAPTWEQSDTRLYVDVKSTRGTHATPLHMTMAEVLWAAQHTRYRIARVSSLSENAAEIRILSGVSDVCQDLLESISGLPDGISVDSFEMNPSLFSEVAAGTVLWNSHVTREPD